jgi:hypothetical protein
MATVTQTTTPAKAFYAHLFDDHGALAKVDGQILFLHSTTGEIVEIEPSMCNFLTVLGEIGLADTQQIMDQIHGGYAAIATGREEGVR